MQDRKTVVFGLLNLLQGGLTGAIPLVVPSREPIVNWSLAALSGLMLLSGPMLVFAGRLGRSLAAVACLLHGAAGTVFAVLIAASASYLYGIYGRHGHSIGAVGFALAVVVLVVFWLIPAHELHFLGKRRSAR